MKVGWLEDGIVTGRAYVGGAELTSDAFRHGAPKGVKIELVGSDQPDVPADVDVWIVQNCTTYRFSDWVGALATSPVVKYVHDVWPHGDLALRGWILQHAARLVFCSPLHASSFPAPFSAKAEVLFPPIDLHAFRNCKQIKQDRIGLGPRIEDKALYLGHNRKGLQRTRDLAERHGLGLDEYGHGAKLGPVPVSSVPWLMAQYKYFAYAPDQLEPFGRTIVEAHAAGCELLLEDDAAEKIGALRYLDHIPSARTCVEQFWKLVADAATI